MDTNTTKNILVKVFFGANLTSELKMHLTNSLDWKNSLINKSTAPLQQVQYQDVHYIGYYMEQNKLKMTDIESHKKEVCHIISNFCPEFNADTLTFFVFPQVFIT